MMLRLVKSSLLCVAVLSMVACGGKKKGSDSSSDKGKTTKQEQTDPDQEGKDKKGETDQSGEQTGQTGEQTGSKEQVGTDQDGTQTDDKDGKVGEKPGQDQNGDQTGDQNGDQTGDQNGDQTGDQNGDQDNSQNDGKIDPAEHGKMYIDKITYGGSGCPTDSRSVSGDISDDGEAFTLVFSDFFVEVNEDSTRSDLRKNCVLNVSIKVPQGWQYSTFKVAYDIHLDLDTNVSAEQKTEYYFMGNGGEDHRVALNETTFEGQVNDSYIIEDKVQLESIEWSPCGGGRNLIIANELSIASMVPSTASRANIP